MEVHQTKGDFALGIPVCGGSKVVLRGVVLLLPDFREMQCLESKRRLRSRYM
jgi:hypothetical protein